MLNDRAPKESELYPGYWFWAAHQFAADEPVFRSLDQFADPTGHEYRGTDSGRRYYPSEDAAREALHRAGFRAAWNAAEKVWTEDDATTGTAGHVDLQQAIREKIGELPDKEASAGFGDCEMSLYVGGWLVMSSYAGNNAIRLINPRLPDDPWANDELQFARLLTEISAAGLPDRSAMQSVRRRMDLTESQFLELFAGAKRKWTALRTRAPEANPERR